MKDFILYMFIILLTFITFTIRPYTRKRLRECDMSLLTKQMLILDSSHYPSYWQ